VISDEFTFDNVAIVAQAIADFIKSQRKPVYRKKKVVVGFDTRFLSDRYARIVSSVLAGNGIKVVLSDRPSPTPAVCVYIKEKKLTGGVMITASHNPPHYNGIKYKGFFGGSADNEIIGKIEKFLHKRKVKRLDMDEAAAGKMISSVNIVDTQIKQIRKYADMKVLRKASLKVLVDSMNGTGDRYLERILKDCPGIKMDFIYDEQNPSFFGRAPEPNEKHLKELMKKVKNGGYDLGIATDGDSDRLAVVDEKGKILSGHKLMALLLLHLLDNRGMKGGVVQTICGTELIERICEKYSLASYETPVGFKYICKIMYTEDILCGGEETGGVGFKGYVPERDGFLSALLIMEMAAKSGEPLSEMLKSIDREYGRFVYEREDLVFEPAKRSKLVKGIKKNPLKKVLGKDVVEIKDYDGTKFICSDGSWLLVRLSGTEPKLRIYSETPSRKRSLEYLDFGKKYALGILNG
jgi:phosphomannomutase